MVSAALHIGLVVLGNLRAAPLALPRPETVIDLTLPLRRIASPPPGKLGRPAPVTTTVVKPPDPVVAPALPSPVPDPVPAADPRPARPDPVPVPAVLEAVPGKGSPAAGTPFGSPAGDPTASGGGGTGPGGRSGTPDVLPRLLNREEVFKDLERFYPEKERDAGKAGRVVVKIRLDAAGTVGSVEVIKSGGAAFDKAAMKVAERMRFSPALLAGQAVPVAFPQIVEFTPD